MSKNSTIIAYIPIETVSEPNQRDHWAVKSSRVKTQRYCVWLFLSRRLYKANPSHKVDIFLTRIGKRFLDDDNLAGAFKAVRDEIAALIGIDDGDSRLKWHYNQILKNKFKGELTIDDGLTYDGLGIEVKVVYKLTNN